MATYKASHLKEMIREVVRAEIREVVSGVIAEVLSERYLHKLAESVAAARPRGVANLSIMGDEEEADEEIPRPLANNVRGVGQENPRFQKTPRQDHVRQHNEGLDGRNRNQTLSLFFEGTKPLAQRERANGMYQPDQFEEVEDPRTLRQLAEQEEPELGSESGPIEEQEEDPRPQQETKRPITEIWKTLAGVDKIEEQVQTAIDPSVRMKMEEDRLKRIREQLEVKAG